jgi:hypothetical protein
MTLLDWIIDQYQVKIVKKFTQFRINLKLKNRSPKGLAKIRID